MVAKKKIYIKKSNVSLIRYHIRGFGTPIVRHPALDA